MIINSKTTACSCTTNSTLGELVLLTIRNIYIIKNLENKYFSCASNFDKSRLKLHVFSWSNCTAIF